MVLSVRSYYSFLGFHSFLIGLLPFFLPVYLFKHGAGLDVISFFIGITGLSFGFCLYLFDRFRSGSARLPILLSFLLEIALLLGLALKMPWQFLALLNGCYSCLYWTIQRIFFLSGGTAENSGRRFGNFQIYVLVSLKLGILTGSALLERFGLGSVCLLSLGVVAFALFSLFNTSRELSFPKSLATQSRLRVSEILKFNDCYNSRIIFLVDGVFLYLESYFWVISLFLLVGESFIRLGSVVVGLAILLGVVFYLIKNRVDRADRQILYSVSTCLYVLSWVLRGCLGLLPETGQMMVQMCTIVIISFFTSFFRLTFNKRFFDLAEKSCSHKYLFLKSYYSQFGLGVIFLLFGLCLRNNNLAASLNMCYWAAAAFSFFYLLYQSRRTMIR